MMWNSYKLFDDTHIYDGTWCINENFDHVEKNTLSPLVETFFSCTEIKKNVCNILNKER